jgi:hypothetical protein
MSATPVNGFMEKPFAVTMTIGSVGAEVEACVVVGTAEDEDEDVCEIVEDCSDSFPEHDAAKGIIIIRTISIDAALILTEVLSNNVFILHLDLNLNDLYILSQVQV